MPEPGDRKREDRDAGQESGFRNCRGSLQSSTPNHAEDVDPRHRHDDGRLESQLAGSSRLSFSEPEQRFHEDHRERTDRGGPAEKKVGPAVEKGDRPAVGFAQIDVKTSRVGEHRAEFRDTERSQQTDQPTHDPGREDHAEIAGVFRDCTGLK